MSILKITKENFDELVLQNEKPVLIDFYADWCGPCKLVGPIVEEIATEHPEIAVGKINVDQDPDLAIRFQVMSIPTLMVFKNGEVTNKTLGFQPKEGIIKML